MGTSRQWPVLKEMDAEGDYSEVVWEYADHGRRPSRKVRRGPPRGARLCPRGRWGLGAQLLGPGEQPRLLLAGERHRELVQQVAQLGDLDLAVLGRMARPAHRDGAVGQ